VRTLAANTDPSASTNRMLDFRPGQTTDIHRPTLVHREASRRPLALYVLPIPAASGAMNQFLSHARTIVLTVDAGNDQPPDPSLVRDVLGITLGEARIASLISTGLSPRKTAESLGIAEETARSALKRVFLKVGVNRQSELASLLTRLILR
jgi:DNA-binding CsgD family transcriptional regulator